MGVKGVWILEKGLCEGTETCQNGLYVCVFASLCKNEEKNKKPHLETSVNKAWLLEKFEGF
jgi:hypothetical protein